MCERGKVLNLLSFVVFGVFLLHHVQGVSVNKEMCSNAEVVCPYSTGWMGG